MMRSGNRDLAIDPIPFAGTLTDRLKTRHDQPDTLSLYWLGQAGFIIDWNGFRLVIDPYLSDSLARKYAASANPHERMMAAPMAASELTDVDLVFCTHHHTDHMDGETLAAIRAASPQACFIVPHSARKIAAERTGLAEDDLVLMDEGDTITLADGITVTAFPAAHEALERDVDGHCKFLGYGITLGDFRMLHAGDTIPFEGQTERYGAFKPDLMLLPVNGRSPAMLAAGFAGNLTLDEAIDLSRRVQAPMIAHHCGLFAFNTVAPEIIDAKVAGREREVIRARLGLEFRLSLA